MRGDKFLNFKVSTFSEGFKLDITLKGMGLPIALFIVSIGAYLLGELLNNNYVKDVGGICLILGILVVANGYRGKSSASLKISKSRK